MKMRNRWFVSGLLAAAAVFLFSGCVTADQSTPEPETETAEETRNETPVPTRPVITESGVRTFGYYMSTETEELDGVPAIETAEGFYSGVVNCNYDCNMISVDYTTKEEYDAYLKLLQSEGFTLYADNGETGIHEDVYNAVLTRDELTLYVIYQALQNKTYIIAGTKENLSPHLIDNDAYRANIRANVPNSLTLMDSAHAQSMGIVIQLKNGHFIVVDGGMTMDEDAENLVKYLKGLAPEGEKPVIEGWFLTHAHGDHYGVLYILSRREDLSNELIVNGFYFNKPNIQWASRNASVVNTDIAIQWLTMTMKDENGDRPKVYRPVFGQRYYFCDTTIEIICSTEMVPLVNSTTDLNETSTMFIVNMDGQKAYIQGDAETADQHIVMNSFRRDYLGIDVYQVSHHGYNTLTEFVDYVSYISTCIDPSHFLVDAVCESGATPYLIEHSKEFYYQGKGNGTIRMSFPYTVGNMEVLGYAFDTYPTWREIIVPNNYGLYIEG